MAIIITKNGKGTQVIKKLGFEKESYMQKYIHDNPESIPIYEIDEDKRLFVVAREFSTESGPIDALAIDNDGDIYVVETKLYKNSDRREAVAQTLDYGASLWRHGDFDDLKIKINEEKVKDFFKIDEEQIKIIIDKIRTNFEQGNIKLVIIMDKIDDALKDLIVYINQKSKFSIYAVQLEYYKYDSYEIIIPKLYGDEVKKDIKSPSAGKHWDWESFKQHLEEKFGNKEVTAAQQIIDWAEKNSIEISWSTSQRGGFIPVFYANKKTWFCPFSITGDAEITWNAPHHVTNHRKSTAPAPFDMPEKRIEILKQLKSIAGAKVDSDIKNINNYNSLVLPLGALADSRAKDKFFAVLLWIKKQLQTESK